MFAITNHLLPLRKLVSLGIVVGFLFLVAVGCSPSRKFLIQNGKRISADKNYVRVLVAKSRERVTVEATSRMKIVDLKSGVPIYSGGPKRAQLSAEKLSKPVLIESANGPITVNGKPYRGSVEIHNQFGTLLAINVLRMDEYLYGVVPSEISKSWSNEALKAQAVAARTFVFHHIGRGGKQVYDVDGTTSFQVYKGMVVESDRTNRAVDATSGEIITYNYQPIVSYFHSTCGGKTSSGRDVFSGSDSAYLASVRCPYCAPSPHYEWTVRLGLDEIRRYVRKSYPSLGRIRGITFRKTEGRVVSVIIRHAGGTLSISGNKFRLQFPDKMIRSTYFTASRASGGLVLKGHGWGHGVGMCQWGAKGLSDSGKSYKDILRYYYRNTGIINMSKMPSHEKRVANRD